MEAQGSSNTALGAGALYVGTSGSSNVAVGNIYDQIEAEVIMLPLVLPLVLLLQLGQVTHFRISNNTSSASANNQTAIGFQAKGQADNSVTLGNASINAVYMGQDADAIVYAGGIRFNDGTTMSTAAGAGADGEDGVDGSDGRIYWWFI